MLAIDYLGLLEGADGEDQWRMLMNIARFLHVWGKANKVICIAAAQLSEEGMLRYAKGLAEHAKYFWSWRVDDITKSTGIVTINQKKARQASDHDFMLQFDLARMTVRDAKPQHRNRASERSLVRKTTANASVLVKTWNYRETL